MLNPHNTPRQQKYSTRDYVYESLRDQIISMELEPGRSISEKEISELLQVSRTPVREAFVMLAKEELLEVYPQRGTTISLIDLYMVEEARFIRENLERATVKLACENFSDEYLERLQLNVATQKKCVDAEDYTKLFELDEQFHYTIAIGSGKERIWTIIQQMKAHLNRIRLLSLAAHLNWDLIVSQHEEILLAIQEKNPQMADEAMEAHLKKLIFDQNKLKEEFPQYFK